MPSVIEMYMNTIREAAPRLRAVSDDLAKVVADLRKDEDLTNEARERRIAAATAEANKMVEEIRSEAREAREAVERYSAKELAESDGLEAGLDHDRSWARLLRRLEAGTAPSDLVDEVAKAGDAAAIKALRRELPDYVKSKAAASRPPGLATLATGQPSDDQVVERLSKQLDRAVLPHLPPKQRNALAARLELPHRAEAVDREVAMAARPSANSRLAAAYAANDADRELEAAQSSD